MKKLFILFFIFSISILSAQATGKLAGRVSFQETDESIENVNVMIDKLGIGTTTKNDGTYIIREIPVGDHLVEFKMVGLKKVTKSVTVRSDETTIANVYLEREALRIEDVVVNANRAIKRETPIAFANLDQEEISDKYTTQDMPQLLEDVPGLFANTTGIGDAQITMRGFEADKIQVLINGIPVNDPESQKVYWSNWTGLSANVKSVQVQKGAGSSLYGSGAFGGSLNIETMGSDPEREFTIRSSYGDYRTDSDVADGKGGITDYDPFNYNVLLRYNSGNLNGGKFNYSLMFERKRGDYYLTGTNYDGYSFGLETQNIFEFLGTHTVNSSFIGAPQEHNQVYFKSDPELMETLGRNYNRNNHKYQENYYFKPQFSLRDKWKINDEMLVMLNTFVTKGDGGGKYLNQDKFDVNTGEIHYHDGFLDSDNPAAYEDLEFGQHALYLYNEYKLIVENFNPVDTVYFGPIPVEGPTYKGELINGNGADFFDSRYDYSWRNNSISDHFQFGGNTYFDYQMSPQFNMVLGGELRKWHANHIGKRENFRHLGDIIGYEVDPETGDSTAVYDVETYEEFQKTYDYTSDVLNFSGFARLKWKLNEMLNFMVDGQWARYSSKVKENPIEIYDLSTGEPTGITFLSTEDLTKVVDQDTVPKFEDDDYKKVYSFFSPKFGMNYNISEYFNFRSNYSIAYKEPRTSEWYGYDGPDTRQMYSKNVIMIDTLGNFYNKEVEYFYGELEPEKINTLEFGVGYDGINFDFDINYYISDYYDKIEYVNVPVREEFYHVENDSIEVNDYDASLVINAGEARHQGLELSSNIEYDNADASASLTLSRNRWTKMNVEEIFDNSAEEMEGKVVPFSPEKMANFDIGYTFRELPLSGKFRIGLTAKYWDGYFANYENEYVSNYVWDGSEYVPEQEYCLTENGNYVIDAEGNYVEVPEGEGNYSLQTKMTSSELPAFIEFGSNLKYTFKIGKKDAFIRLDLNNIMNKKDNYLSANVRSDYNRGIFTEDGTFIDDYLTGNDYMYVTPAPLFNIFLTMEVRF